LPKITLHLKLIDKNKKDGNVIQNLNVTEEL